MAGTVPCGCHKGAILASACCMPVRRQTMRKGRMACGGDNPPYAQITPPLWLPGPSFCWQGPQCRSIFDLTSTANHRDGAECQEEVGLFAYWAGASRVGGNECEKRNEKNWWGRTVKQSGVEDTGSNTYKQNKCSPRQTNKQTNKEQRGLGTVQGGVFCNSVGSLSSRESRG